MCYSHVHVALQPLWGWQKSSHSLGCPRIGEGVLSLSLALSFAQTTLQFAGTVLVPSSGPWIDRQQFLDWLGYPLRLVAYQGKKGLIVTQYYRSSGLRIEDFFFLLCVRS